jgi:hypothetical protein
MTDAEIIATNTQDAYSCDRYGPGEWTKSIQLLLDRGYTQAEVEAIMRSKWTRWAGDCSDNEYGSVAAQDLINFIDNPRNRCQVSDVMYI